MEWFLRRARLTAAALGAWVQGNGSCFVFQQERGSPVTGNLDKPGIQATEFLFVFCNRHGKFRVTGRVWLCW